MARCQGRWGLLSGDARDEAGGARFMARALQAVMNVLVVNGAACGNDATCNAIRLAGALAWVCRCRRMAR
jgi:hypothetical protein